MKSVEQLFVELFKSDPKGTLAKIMKLVNDGYVNVKQHHIYHELSIFNYSKSTAKEQKWDIYSMMCRGLVIDTRNLEIKALPFAKFFNLGELDDTELCELSLHNRTQNYDVYVSMSGSLGIGFFHRNTFIWTTKRSFTSEQADFANKFIRDKYTEYQLSEIYFYYENMTIMAEILYPYDKLVLLTLIRNTDGKEIPYCDLVLEGKSLDLEVVEKYEDYNTLGDILSARETWTTTQGVVIRYDNNKRLNIKGLIE